MELSSAHLRIKPFNQKIIDSTDILSLANQNSLPALHQYVARDHGIQVGVTSAAHAVLGKPLGNNKYEVYWVNEETEEETLPPVMYINFEEQY